MSRTSPELESGRRPGQTGVVCGALSEWRCWLSPGLRRGGWLSIWPVAWARGDCHICSSGHEDRELLEGRGTQGLWQGRALARA